MIPPPPPHTDADALFDFETYGEAGLDWSEERQRWVQPVGAPGTSRGLGVVGAAAYSEHPSTEVLTLSYRLPWGWRITPMALWPTLPKVGYRWRPGEPNPQPLFDYLATGGTLEAHNVGFERHIWTNVCVPKYGWPSLEPYVPQLRCSMAKARVNSFPAALANLSSVLALPIPKDKDGKRLLDKFSVPRSPTKGDPRLRIRPEDDPEDFERLRAYCDTDLDAEHGASHHPRMKPLTAAELEAWQHDQEINFRGLGVDRKGITDCIVILNQALAKYGDECRAITGFDPTQLAELKGWLAAQGVHMDSMDAAHLEAALDPHARPLPPLARRVLEIRQLIGSASVKKLFAMDHQATRDDRLRNLLNHHGSRPGRPTGEGPQPLNLPKAGPSLFWCGGLPKGEWNPAGCREPFGTHHDACPWCGQSVTIGGPPRKWSADAVETVLGILALGSLELVEWYFGDALLCISGCLRGLFVAKPGHELIASDYSSLQAVVGAMLSGCQWRIDAFREGKPIYLLGASKITGKSLEYYLEYKEATGEHHPDRQSPGKISELACLFGGWVGSYVAFGSTEPEDVIKSQILAWRDASPEFPEMWGGQWRGKPWDGHPEMFGYEGCAVQAIQYPGMVFDFRGVKFQVRNDALIITLLSDRELTYHHPRLTPSSRRGSRPGELSITYWTWNSNPKYGAMGWVMMDTYGGRITENVVMGHEVCIMRYAIKNLRAAGYNIVLPVYDEAVAEVPIGFGSIEEFERIMATMPPWAADWPIKAEGGWRARRYRKAA